MKSRVAYLFVPMLVAFLSACSKDECVEPRTDTSAEEKLLIISGDDQTTDWSDERPGAGSSQAVLRNGDDTNGEEEGQGGDGTGISDDGDDSSDSEKSNR